MTGSMRVFLGIIVLMLSQGADADELPSTSGGTSFDFVSEIYHSPSAPEDSGFDGDVFSVGTYAGDLIVGGQFFTAAGINAVKIVGFNGSSWYDMNIIPSGNTVYDLLEFNGKLYTGYSLAFLNEWDGSSWTQLLPRLVDGFSHPIWAVAEYDSQVVCGGDWISDNGNPSYIAAWNGSGWDSLGSGEVKTIRDLTVFNGELIAGGFFTTADGSISDRIAAWDGNSWRTLAGGMADGGVWVMTVYNGELIAGGTFTSAGGNAVSRIARWNGTDWQPLGNGFDGTVRALTVYNGSLIAGGFFLNSGGTSTPYVASWDGSTWSPLGTELDDGVEALTVYNGYLIAGGRFDTAAGGKVALWDGANWVPVSSVVTAVDENDQTVPAAYSLHQNYPNPFNPSTVIEFSLLERAQTRVDIVNIQGQLVTTLLDQSMTAGEHAVTWDGTDAAGEQVASGMYFYRLTVDDRTEAKKMLLLK